MLTLFSAEQLWRYILLNKKNRPRRWCFVTCWYTEAPQIRGPLFEVLFREVLIIRYLQDTIAGELSLHRCCALTSSLLCSYIIAGVIFLPTHLSLLPDLSTPRPYQLPDSPASDALNFQTLWRLYAGLFQAMVLCNLLIYRSSLNKRSFVRSLI